MPETDHFNPLRSVVHRVDDSIGLLHQFAQIFMPKFGNNPAESWKYFQISERCHQRAPQPERRLWIITGHKTHDGFEIGFRGPGKD